MNQLQNIKKKQKKLFHPISDKYPIGPKCSSVANHFPFQLGFPKNYRIKDYLFYLIYSSTNLVRGLSFIISTNLVKKFENILSS